MAQVRASGFVRADTLTWGSSDGVLCYAGEMACLGSIRIRVMKTFDASLPHGEDELISAFQYAYTASIVGKGRIVQYDNAHPHQGHFDAYHCHLLNYENDAELRDSPFWVGEAQWPTLSDFIQSVETWYRVNCGEPDYPAPHGPPSIIPPQSDTRFPGFKLL